MPIVKVEVTPMQAISTINTVYKMPGSRGFKRCRAGIIAKIFKAFPELDYENGGEGFDDTDPRMKEKRAFEVDSQEINAMGEGLLTLAANVTNDGAGFSACARIAKQFGIGPWFDKETTEAIPEFKGDIEGKQTPAQAAATAPEKTP